jgi:ubiquinone biosynthesis monooxygenase Coq7
MSARALTLADRVIGEIDKAINVLCATPHPGRPLPSAAAGDSAAAAGASMAASPALREPDRVLAARLMRVNHAGEVAAQALYRGQAVTARDPGMAHGMLKAAAEEMDHLAWCDERLKELNGRTSLLNPLWYAGSFLIGAVAGVWGDRASLGFIAETERQVESHLRDHLERLPADDRRSRAILEQMTHDEIQHGANATALGGKELPLWLKGAMRLTSKLMTRGSYLV